VGGVVKAGLQMGDILSASPAFFSLVRRLLLSPQHTYQALGQDQHTTIAMGLLSAPKTTVADPVLTRLVNEDKVGWYSKPNLRRLYICLFFCCMGVEMTSGFDSQLINTLQFS